MLSCSVFLFLGEYFFISLSILGQAQTLLSSHPAGRVPQAAAEGSGAASAEAGGFRARSPGGWARGGVGCCFWGTTSTPGAKTLRVLTGVEAGVGGVLFFASWEFSFWSGFFGFAFFVVLIPGWGCFPWGWLEAGGFLPGRGGDLGVGESQAGVGLRRKLFLPTAFAALVVGLAWGQGRMLVITWERMPKEEAGGPRNWAPTRPRNAPSRRRTGRRSTTGRRSYYC